jgi:hypothetical protein
VPSNPLSRFHPREQWRGLLGTAVIVLSILVIIVSVTHHEDPAPYTPVNPQSDGSAATPSAAPSKHALIIGDADAKGVATALCRSQSWTCTVNAVANTGYVAGGASAYGSASRISTQVAAAKDPSVIVVVGGRADAGSSPQAEAAAVLRDARDLHAAAPAAKLVYIGPFSGTDTALDSLDAGLDLARVGLNVVVAHPRAQSWIPASDLTATGALTPAGQKVAATKIQAALQSAGIG